MATDIEYGLLAALAATACVGIGCAIAREQPERELQENFETAANGMTAIGCGYATAFSPEDAQPLFATDGSKCSVLIDKDVDIAKLADSLRERLKTDRVVTSLRGEAISFDKSPRVSYTPNGDNGYSQIHIESASFYTQKEPVPKPAG